MPNAKPCACGTFKLNACNYTEWLSKKKILIKKEKNVHNVILKNLYCPDKVHELQYTQNIWQNMVKRTMLCDSLYISTSGFSSNI